MEIKSAYKQRALEYHPDKHTESEGARRAAEEKFKLLGEALEILGDEFQRKLYDEGYDKAAIAERVQACLACKCSPRRPSPFPTGTTRRRSLSACRRRTARLTRTAKTAAAAAAATSDERNQCRKMSGDVGRCREILCGAMTDEPPTGGSKRGAAMGTEVA
jgi:curved DNA-binding protein CbpA